MKNKIIQPNQMKTVSQFFLCLFILASLKINAQESNFCGQQIITEAIFKKYPELKKRFDSLQSIQTEPQQKLFQTSSGANYTVPVVFHILHLGGQENISDAQINDQITILNRDYQKQNADTINVVQSFTNNIANVKFAFRLATIDPFGNCTNGIIRHYTTKTDWDANDLNQFIYSWPTNKYLNIYVVRSINISATAYAFLPGTPIPLGADVIVSMYNMVGSIGAGTLANSRVLTHEVAHWFNLQHIWGTSNSPGVVCGDDAVNDTPITKGYSICLTANSNQCNTAIFENVQNYMDYSPCKIMFTNGQAARMLSCMNGALNGRNNISSPSNLMATGVNSVAANCIPKAELVAIKGQTLCTGTVFSVNAYTYNAIVSNYSWTANNAMILSSTTNSSVSVQLNTTGNVTITCLVSNSNGSSLSTITISAQNANAQNINSYTESFESNNLPQNWQVINPTTPASLWRITNEASSHGSQCMYIDAENTPGGSVEVLETPSYDFLNNPGSVFSFKYAYAKKSATHNDVFKVQASKDCGGTWETIYEPNMSAFASSSGNVINVVFTPFLEQWKYYDVSAHPNFINFLNQSNVRFRFYFKEDTLGYGNRIYLDQINFITADLVGVRKNQTKDLFKVYPNPNQGHVSIKLSEELKNKPIKIEIANLLGQTIMTKQSLDSEIIDFKIEALPQGLYLIQVQGEGKEIYSQKIMKQ